MTLVRRMVIVDPTMATEGGYVPHLVYEDSADMMALGGHGSHSRAWIWGPTLDEAKEQADNYNRDALRLSDDDMTEILASVMAAGERAAIVRDGYEAVQHAFGYTMRAIGKGEDETGLEQPEG